MQKNIKTNLKRALNYSENCRRTKLYYQTFQELFRNDIPLECKIDDTDNWIDKVYLFEPMFNNDGGIRYRVKCS